MIEIEQQITRDGEIAVRIEYADGEGMELAVREHACKRRQVHAIGLEVERLNAGDGFPQKRIDTPGVNPGIHRSDAGGPAIDGDLCFAEAGAATALQGTREVTGHAQVPELVVRLTLRNNIEVDS